MALNPTAVDRFASSLASCTPRADDRPPARLLGETVRGIIASASPCRSRIAAFSPSPRRIAAR